MKNVEKPNLRVRRGLLRLALGGLLLLPVGVAGVAWADSGPASDKVTVTIDNFHFNPNELHIKAGTTVTWTNQDDIPHSIVAIGKNLRSKALDTDQSFTFKFDQAGTYNYMCGLHPMMKGKIIVSG